ncbi:hypothetical protein RHSIM_Rhsim08G0049500 [Rhododendron simsii]|uniref:CCHC-type domain-containing protein n=1 Tax=Rhododendron simsii TaxID=118357 RepID=A0A834LE24_RHOSS|nr:hypothetical protein RHSIM_Rhsim08G0049500 [Rhododendron simsii]
MDSILCDELLEEVLRCLPPRSTLSSHTAADISLVSKRWLRLHRSSRSTLSLRLSPDNLVSEPLSEKSEIESGYSSSFTASFTSLPAIPRFDGHYDHWSMLMENFLRSKEYWTVVVSGVAEPAEGVVLTDAQKAELDGLKLKDLKAKNYLFQAIDRSILETILCKDSAKHIWDSMKKKYQGSARAKRLQLQAFRSEFEMLRMKSGESVTDYFSRTMTIVNKMRIHGDKTSDVTVVEKILRSMATKFNFVVCSIEEANDIDELSIDELQSSLLVHEQKINQQEKEEQALKASSENHSTTSRADRGRGGRGRGRGGRGNNDRGNQQHHQHQENQFQGRGRGRGGFHSTSYGPKSADKSNVECYKCHRYGHYQSECRTNLTRQSGERTNFAEKEEEVSILMVCHVKEETPQNMWYLDTGCSNHMCGDKKLFSNLDESFHNTVKFGDNSTVAVMGKGSVTIQPKGNLTHTISNVLFVPDLKTNLLSVGQLQEKGYKISIKGGVCQIQDAKLGLIAQVNMTANRMFPLHLHNTNHSCFSAKLRLEFVKNVLLANNTVINFHKDHHGERRINWSTHVLNRSPTLAVQNMTPEEAWSGRRPAVDHFRIFGCVAYAHIPDQKRKKLDDKGEKCIFLGVSDQSKAYKLYNPITKKILISRDVIFDEAQTWPWNTNVVGEQIPTSFDGENDDEANQSKQRLVPAIATLENPQNEAPMASEITPTTPEVDEQVEAAAGSRSHRVRKRPAWMSDYEVPGIDQSDDPLTHFALFSDCDPTVFESAMKDCNPVSIPSEFGLKLNKDNGGKMVDNTLFKQIVGSLMYLTATRPDIMHAVSVLSRYVERLTEFHLLAAKRVFRYLQASKGNNLDGELKLETLSLTGIRCGDCGLDGLWKSCKKLKKLQLRRCRGIGDDTSVSSFNNCLKCLREVELRCCESIGNYILTRMVESCTSLNALLIHSRDYGCREGLLQFFTHSSCNLQKLDLYLPRDLQDNHLLAVAEKFRDLLSLRLCSCFRVTGEGLKNMALAMSNNKLEELALIECNVGPGFLTTLGQSSRNLRKLDLSCSDNWAEEEFISMLALLNCLRELKVSACERLTNASVVSMFKSCKQLESVDLMGCGGIEAEAVELFVVKCPQLRRIRVEESKLSDVSRSWASKKFVEVIVD